MSPRSEPIRVLYSFPHKLGADRICTTAWQQVKGLADAGAKVAVFPGAIARAVPPGVDARPTLARGRYRIPYSILGHMRAFTLHDYIVSQRLKRLADQIDIVHVWPLGALRTLKTAAQLGIPAVLERPNAHTQYAYEVVRRECEKLGVVLPRNHEHAFRADILAKENLEYELATRLLCPSEFVAETFLQHGFPPERLARHQYGFDDQLFYADAKEREGKKGFRLLFVGGCAPRKGLHYALEAWQNSGPGPDDEFLIAGSFVPGYAERLGSLLSQPTVHVLGHRRDVPELMRSCDALTLPSIEEGSALVTSEARGSGCVLLVSDASGAICQHLENALVHHAGDVAALTSQIAMLRESAPLRERLRAASLRTVQEITWKAAGRRLLSVYEDTIESYSQRQPSSCSQSTS